MTSTKLLFIKMTNNKDFQRFIETKYNALYVSIIACKGNWDHYDNLSTQALRDYHKTH